MSICRRLYAGNLSFEMTDAGLQQVFGRVGGVERAEVIRDRWTGFSRGFGFVDMMTVEDTETAIAELDGVDVMGRVMRVALAKPHDASQRSREPAREQSVE
jgi:RNA recognition motif-containing protein